MKASGDECEPRAALSFEVQLDAPPARVWRALTVPEFVARWLESSIADPEAEQMAADGAKPSPSPASLRLLDCDPQRSVRYAWSEERSSAVESIVTFSLRPNDAGGAILNIVHEMMLGARAQAREAAANSNAPALLLAA